MPRIAAISLARLSIKNIPRKKLLLLTNVIIFISLFAVTAAIISLVFEKKIEEQNKKLSNEYGNEIIYNHWLATAPKNINRTENILSQISTGHNYLIYIKGLNEKLITNRELVHNLIVAPFSYILLDLRSLAYSLNDSLIVSSSSKDLVNISEFRKEHQRISNKYWETRDKYKLYVLNSFFEMTYRDERWDDDAYLQKLLSDLPNNVERGEIESIKNIYDKALLAKKDLIIILNEIKDLNIKLNIIYYSQKKAESQKRILRIKESIRKYSQNESRSILIAFFIQLVIFFIIQYFEFGFEALQNIKKQIKS